MRCEAKRFPAAGALAAGHRRSTALGEPTGVQVYLTVIGRNPDAVRRPKKYSRIRRHNARRKRDPSAANRLLIENT